MRARERHSTVLAPPVALFRRVPRTGLRIAVAVSLLLGLTGCGQRAEPDRPPTDAERLEQLRSLPYTGGLPADHADPSGVIRKDPGTYTEGVRLYTVPMLGRAELIRADGERVHEWKRPADRWERAELLPDGSLLVIGIAGRAWKKSHPPDGNIPDEARYLAKFDWDGETIWKRPMLVHHDVEQEANGELLVLALQRRMIPAVDPEVEVRDDEIVRLDSGGNLIESSSLYDGAVASDGVFPLQAVEPEQRNYRERIDLFHANSIESIRRPKLAERNPIYGPGNILVSVRHQDRVGIYDPTRARFVWSWGEGVILGPHDAHLLESGNVLLFDNGLGRKWSRAVEVDPLHNEIVWSWEATPRDSFYSASRGSVQRLPNGNTLLAESDRGRAVEISADGDIVWEFVCPYFLGDEKRAAIVRMVVYGEGYLGD